MTTSEISELLEECRALIRRVETLDEGAGQQIVDLRGRAKSNRRLINIIIAGFTLDVLLTIAMLAGGIALNHTAQKTNEIAGRVNNSQTVQRQKALCPLYQIFLDSQSPEARAQAVDKAKYDHAFVVIQQGYDALECDTFRGEAPHLGR